MSRAGRDAVPIGLLLSRADEAISDRFAQTLAAERIGRIQWQLLNIAGVADQTAEQIIAKMPPGLATSEVATAIDELVTRGWIERGGLTLSDDGARAQQRIEQLVDRIRERASAGIGRDDWAATLRTLTRIIENLAPAPPTGSK